MSIIFTIKDNDWNSVRQAIQKLASTKLGSVATPTFYNLNLTSLSVVSATISSIVFTSATGFQTLGVTSATISSLVATSARFVDAYITAPNQVYLLDHDLFAGFVADEHIPHSGVVITANAPLSGGGTISATRTFSLAYTSTLAVSTGALHVLATALAHDSLGAVHQSVTTTASPVFAGLLADTNTLSVDPINHRVGVLTTAPTTNFEIYQGTVGPGTVTISGTACTGTGTYFKQTFKPGDSITITATGETKVISAIASDVAMTIVAATGATDSTYTLVGGTRFAVYGNGNVGFGMIPYSNDTIDVANNTPNKNLTVALFAARTVAGGDGVDIKCWQCGGAITTPTATLDNSQLGRLLWGGYGDSAYREAANVIALSRETFTNTTYGTDLVFSSTSVGGTLAESARFHNHRLGLRTADPGATLDVRGNVALGVITTAYAAFSTCGDFTSVGSAVISARLFSVATAIITALENNQMTLSQTTLGLTINIQGNDGIWRTGTLALLSGV